MRRREPGGKVCQKSKGEDKESKRNIKYLKGQSQENVDPKREKDRKVRNSRSFLSRQ